MSHESGLTLAADKERRLNRSTSDPLPLSATNSEGMETRSQQLSPRIASGAVDIAFGSYDKAPHYGDHAPVGFDIEPNSIAQLEQHTAGDVTMRAGCLGSEPVDLLRGTVAPPTGGFLTPPWMGLSKMTALSQQKQPLPHNATTAGYGGHDVMGTSGAVYDRTLGPDLPAYPPLISAPVPSVEQAESAKSICRPMGQLHSLSSQTASRPMDSYVKASNTGLVGTRLDTNGPTDGFGTASELEGCSPEGQHQAFLGMISQPAARLHSVLDGMTPFEPSLAQQHFSQSLFSLPGIFSQQEAPAGLATVASGQIHPLVQGLPQSRRCSEAIATGLDGLPNIAPGASTVQPGIERAAAPQRIVRSPSLPSYALDARVEAAEPPCFLNLGRQSQGVLAKKSAQLLPSSRGAGNNHEPAKKAAKVGSAKPKEAPANESMSGKRKAPKRGPRKKPDDMPRRPLSGYNIYFSEERNRILNSQHPAGQQQGGPSKSATKGALDILSRPLVPSHLKPRRHRKTHGKVGFQELARTIAKRWKELDEGTRQYYQDLAREDRKRQRAAMDEYYAKYYEMIHAETATSEEGEAPKTADDAGGTGTNGGDRAFET